MRASVVGFLVVASALGLAGCLADETPDGAKEGDEIPRPDLGYDPFVPEVPDFDFSSIVDPDHVGHEVPLLHSDSHGLRVVGHTGVGSILPPGMRGSITQIDVRDGYAVVPGMEQGPAFVIVDIRDPKDPKPVSYAPTIADGWTARFSKDGQYVFYGCQVLGPPYAPGGVVRGDCTDASKIHGNTSPAAAGISVWDVRDKENPTFVDFVATGGSHNLQVANINGTDYVFTAKTTILKFDRETNELAQIAEVPGVHDSTVAQHPVTGDWLLYTGGSSGGIAIYNVNDPAEPQAVLESGVWTSSNGTGWHDQVQAPVLIDGRALLALAGESFVSSGSLEVGTLAQGVPDVVTIVDVTDPTHPTKLSVWAPPFTANLPWASYTFSVHEMAFTPQGQLAVSWYHGGAWVIDLSTTERQADPATLAAFQPNEPVNVVPSTFAQTPLPLVPFVWSVGWDERGYLVVPDMHTGIYVLEPDWGLHRTFDGGA